MVLSLRNFLASYTTVAQLQQHTTVCFRAQTYPLLFFSLLHAYIKQQGMVLHHISLDSLEESQVIGAAQTSFLGQQTYYWLGMLEELEEKKKKRMLAWLANYKGPHILAFCTGVETAYTQQGLTIDIQASIDDDTMNALLQFFYPKTKQNTLIKALSKQKRFYNLDTTCLLLNYMQVLGAHTTDFVHTWLDRLIAPDQSLFTLSGYLLAKKPEPFFTQWSKTHELYPDVFWFTFWSEQVWRAYYVVDYLTHKQPMEAKKIASRLPFSFIQRDWKLHTPASLQQAHDFLYKSDNALKNGGSSSLALQSFYARFFAT